MNIQLIGPSRTIMSNPGSLHNYFGWPSVARLQDGRIAVAASGYRITHICPFGKAVLSYSADEGETYTRPAPIIDTVLDDRDAGIVPASFSAAGANRVIFTSFNNTVQFQRKRCLTSSYDMPQDHEARRAYCMAYLDLVTPEAEAAALGSTYCISEDGGTTFGPVRISPVTSPHGPAALQDGSWLWVGRKFFTGGMSSDQYNHIQAYSVHADGTMEYAGEIENIWEDGVLLEAHEPHAVQLPDGTIICHIRVQQSGDKPYFTLYQSESNDGGHTWTKPHAILDPLGGAPAHLLYHSSGVLISVYSYREMPYGIRAMLSRDGGRTWEKDFVLYENPLTKDLGYPATAELSDGSLLTVFYGHTEAHGPAVILQQKWKLID